MDELREMRPLTTQLPALQFSMVSLAVAAVFVTSCGLPRIRCSEVQLSTQRSAGNQWEVEVVENSCLFPARSTNVVRVSRLEEPSPPWGRVAGVTIVGGKRVSARWIDETLLEINLSQSSE